MEYRVKKLQYESLYNRTVSKRDILNFIIDDNWLHKDEDPHSLFETLNWLMEKAYALRYHCAEARIWILYGYYLYRKNDSEKALYFMKEGSKQLLSCSEYPDKKEYLSCAYLILSKIHDDRLDYASALKYLKMMKELNRESPAAEEIQKRIELMQLQIC